MAVAETARLIASLELKDNFSASARKIEQSIAGLGKSATNMSKAVASSRASAVALGVGIERVAEKGVGLLVDAVQGGVDALGRLQTAQEQTAAVIASTGAKAGVSADQVRSYAEALEQTTTVDDKAIQGAENLLLTFTGIGKGAFPQATKAVIDLGVAMAQGDVANADFKSSAIQIGKALNDPTKGITALTRVGVSFTEKQKATIKALQESGDLLGAQKVILAELETEFGKAGQAAGTGFAADQRRLQDAVEDAQIALAKGLLPALQEVVKFITTKLQDPRAQQFFNDLGKNIGTALQAGLDFAQKIPWDSIGNALSIAASAAKTIFDLFTSLPPWVQTAVITGWGLNKISGGALTDLIGSAGKGLLGGVTESLGKGIFSRGATPAAPLYVKDVAPKVPGAGGGPDILTGGSGASKLLKAFSLLSIATDVLSVIATQQAVSGQSSEQGQAISARVAETIAGGASIADLKTELAAVSKGIDQIQSNPLLAIVQGTALDDLKKSQADILAALKRMGVDTAETADNTKPFKNPQGTANPSPFLRPGQASPKAGPASGRAGDELAGLRAGVAAATQRAVDLRGKAADDIEAVKRATAAAAIGFGKLVSVASQFAPALREGLAGLRTATERNDIRGQAKKIADAITKGAGNAANTKKAIDELKAAQAKAIASGDTALAHELGGYISKVEAKLPNREFVQRQLDYLKGAQSDGRITAEETKKLKSIQAQLLARGDTHAASIISRAIDTAKTSQKASDADTRSELANIRAAQNASTQASNSTTQAIKDKDLSVSVNPLINLTSIVSIRGLAAGSRILGSVQKNIAV